MAQRLAGSEYSLVPLEDVPEVDLGTRTPHDQQRVADGLGDVGYFTLDTPDAEVTAGFFSALFGWRVEQGHGHYYAIQGPTFIVEYDNTQNDANHIHSVWRQFEGDWGEDILAQHYASSHGRP